MSESDDAFVYDAANEAVIIGAAISNRDARKKLVHRLSADEFLIPKHAVIWRALRGLTDEGLEYESRTARRFLIQAGGDEKAAEYLKGIEEDARIPENIDFHAETLSWDATRARALKGPIPELLRAIKDPKAPQVEVLTAARAIARAMDGVGRRHVHRPTELARSYTAEIAARRVSRNVFPLGLAEFDKNLSEGFMPCRTTVSAGLPGAGKSTVWIAFAIQLAKMGRRVLYCAWEMPVHSLIDVAVSHLTGIDLTKIIQGVLTDEDADRVLRATKWITSRIKFMGNPFFDKGGKGKPSNDRNLDILEGYIAETNPHVAIYDLWERMLAWREPDAVAGALFRMQAMHEEYNLHGVILNQLRSKDVETRSDRRPTRESIKGSSAYVEVADLIFGIHREGQFKAVEDNRVETICLKQRKGKLNWAIRWEWDGATCAVHNPEEVPFDPGLDSAVDAGDIGRSVKDIRDIKSGRNKADVARPKIGSRE